MILPQSKMPRLHTQLLLLLLLFLLLPQPSQAASLPKPRSEAFWRRFCGFFCPYQLSCDSEVYLSSQQQLDLLNSQEFLDILELFPQILLENEKLQHTTLVRLEDHQRDLILLRYKDFFHPRETLPLARQRIVSQLTEDQQDFEGVPIAEPPPQQNAEANEIHLTEDQVQDLIQKNTSPADDHMHQNTDEIEETLGTPNWNEAEKFIRDYVDQQRIQQSKATHLQDTGEQHRTQNNVRSGQKNAVKQSVRDNSIALDINQLHDHGTHLNVDQILKELEKMGHSFDLNDLITGKGQDPDEGIPQSALDPHRTRESDQTVLNQEEALAGSHKNSNCKHSRNNKESRTKHVNRISDRKSKNNKEPYSDSHDAKTLEEYFYRHQTNLPSKQQITQALAYLNSAPSSKYNSVQSRTGNKRMSPSQSEARPGRLGQHHPGRFIHEPGGRAGDDEGEEEEDRGPQETTKRHSRRKREVIRLQVCPVEETWSNIVLAETVNGTLVQIAQFPEVNLEQWFLEERCLYEESQIIRGVTCEIRERLVDAVVIPVVDPSQPIQTAKIKVDCCMSMFNVDIGY